ncbi:MAG: hypothetical protein ACRD08_00535, partial [Acidimicrobiales bacterium]
MLSEPDAAPLLSTTLWFAVWPSVVEGKVTELGEATSGAEPGSGSMAVPERGTLTAPVPELLTWSAADRGPAVVGENTTGSVRDSPGSSTTAESSSNWSATTA